MWILKNMNFQKCEGQRWILANAFDNCEFSRLWIFKKVNYEKCEFWKMWVYKNVNFKKC